MATGGLTVFLEDLNVKPGDVITYYAPGRGRRARPALGRIAQRHFFLEVKPYEEEFVASEGQSGQAGEPETRPRRSDRAAERHHGGDLED